MKEGLMRVSWHALSHKGS